MQHVALPFFSYHKVYFLASVLVLVNCYDNKMAKATPHLLHPFIDSAIGKNQQKKSLSFMDNPWVMNL